MTFLQFSVLAVSLASLINATPLSTNPYNAPRQRSSLTPAPLLTAQHPHGSVNNSFIVVLKDGLHPSLLENHFNFLRMAHYADPLTADASSGVQQIYDGHITGYAGKFTEAVIDQVRGMPEVDYVERDQIVRTMDIQKSAPWGLARISHRPRLTFSTFTKYEYDASGGDGVDVYVIDTGINVEHVEFQGRASWGKTIPQNDVDEDGNGHGTHCAGTIASRKYGVAKNANVVAVKVLGSNGSGSMSDVVGGVVWAVNQATAKAEAARQEFKATGKTAQKGSVASMSLGGGSSRALDSAVNKAVDNGVHFAVAAGNDNRDACNYSPAAAEKAVTVGASTLGDERAYFSNHGKCVDVFAPGLNILSTYKGSPIATATLSGTSMACPHTAGILAYLLSIYPSVKFDPSLADLDMIPQPLTPPSTSAPSLTSVYASVYSVLPSWVGTFLPPPMLVAAVAGEDDEAGEWKTLTPSQLKVALIKLSSKGLLSDLPDQTPNLLIFNNFTSS